MLACLASSTIERISNFTIPVAGALREGAGAVLFVALPLALASPILAPEEGARIVQSASLHSSPSMSVIIDEASVLEPDEPATASLVPLPPSETASAVTPVEVTPVEVKEVVSTAAALEVEPVALAVHDQGLALDELHDEVRPPVLIDARVEDPRDVRVIQ